MDVQNGFRGKAITIIWIIHMYWFWSFSDDLWHYFADGYTLYNIEKERDKSTYSTFRALLYYRLIVWRTRAREREKKRSDALVVLPCPQAREFITSKRMQDPIWLFMVLLCVNGVRKVEGIIQKYMKGKYIVLQNSFQDNLLPVIYIVPAFPA